MNSPTTSYLNGGSSVKIEWTAPYTNPAALITAYSIIIEDANGNW